MVVVHGEETPLACGGLQRVDDATAEIKRMWVAPTERGSGMGRRLLSHLEGLAAEFGYTRVVLDTNATLTEAIAMYERCGYQAIERYNDNPYAQRWFAKDLTAKG
jgi:GNAT superfamily N-acetyltransferase